MVLPTGLTSSATGCGYAPCSCQNDEVTGSKQLILFELPHPQPPWLPPLAMNLLDKPSRSIPKGTGHDPPGLPEVQCTKVKDFKFLGGGGWGSLVLFFVFLQGWGGGVVLQCWKLDIGLFSTKQARDH